MATFTVTIVAGATTHTKSRTISAAHLIRMINAERVLLRMPGATDAQVFSAWVDKLISLETQRVKGQEATAAQEEALGTVSEIGWS